MPTFQLDTTAGTDGHDSSLPMHNKHESAAIMPDNDHSFEKEISRSCKISTEYASARNTSPSIAG
jgi:hypothetical protein